MDLLYVLECFLIHLIINKHIVMKNISLSVVFLFFCFSGIAQSLNGAWQLFEKDGNEADAHVIKLYSNAYFTYASYHKDTGKFIEAGGGRYILDFFNYKEHYDIDSTDPERSRKTTNYKAVLDDDVLRITNIKTGAVERWRKFDDANEQNMTTCWRIHDKLDEGDDDWRRIVYGPRKTLKMVTNNRYQILALNSETGEFVNSSGGTWTLSNDEYTEYVEFFSKDESNVGTSLTFKRKYQDELWHHSGRDTKGKILMERWLKYK